MEAWGAVCSRVLGGRREARMSAHTPFLSFSVCQMKTMVCSPLCLLRWESRCFQVWGLSGGPGSFQKQEVAAGAPACLHHIPQFRFLWAQHEEALGNTDTHSRTLTHSSTFILAHTHTLSHIPIHSHSQAHSHTLLTSQYTPTYSPIQDTHVHSHTHTLSHPCMFSYTLTHTLTRTHSNVRAHLPMLTASHKLTHSYTYARTHCHTRSRSQTHTFIHIRIYFSAFLVSMKRILHSMSGRW